MIGLISKQLAKGTQASKPDTKETACNSPRLAPPETNSQLPDSRFSSEVAVRIVDVAADFRPEIKAAPIGDSNKTLVVVFAGTSGHGKSTEINAFISYLLGGEVDDSARILAIDDRGAPQSGSVTQMVTCYRIRPLSSLFQGKKKKKKIVLTSVPSGVRPVRTSDAPAAAAGRF
ncbi:hypothetical protein MAPG_11245 [Magnaporthiopsis poae ATCC 64411]|uniref:Uncharacterized protein n=1 Tax=Magnaporthiopsis poae (strain ATCC 64411 / 73-15) TaxID=644358 RepID=A0A0C4EER6_MAGP6|nr:hypothetical protein MAPG_11245 [Magnaporthiopsis poae ATCC 64411]